MTSQYPRSSNQAKFYCIEKGSPALRRENGKGRGSKASLCPSKFSKKVRGDKGENAKEKGSPT